MQQLLEILIDEFSKQNSSSITKIFFIPSIRLIFRVQIKSIIKFLVKQAELK